MPSSAEQYDALQMLLAQDDPLAKELCKIAAALGQKPEDIFYLHLENVVLQPDIVKGYRAYLSTNRWRAVFGFRDGTSEVVDFSVNNQSGLILPAKEL